jgi:hypothetical protein
MTVPEPVEEKARMTAPVRLLFSPKEHARGIGAV